MERDAVYWLEQGMLVALGYRAEERPTDDAVKRLLALLPPIGGIARLWGSLEPQRAAGMAAVIGVGPLRGAARAAAMEFAEWPLPMVAGVLKRAESDLLRGQWHEVLSPAVLLDLADGVALAWARHAPDELRSVHCRLHQPLGAPPGAGLWVDAIRQQAAARSRLPSAGDVPPGTAADWHRQAQWSLTAAQRSRACLALAVAALEDEAE